MSVATIKEPKKGREEFPKTPFLAANANGLWFVGHYSGGCYHGMNLRSGGYICLPNLKVSDVLNEGEEIILKQTN